MQGHFQGTCTIIPLVNLWVNFACVERQKNPALQPVFQIQIRIQAVLRNSMDPDIRPDPDSINM